MIDLSIIIPHKSTRDNDKALSMAIASIVREDANIEVLIDTTVPKDPYIVCNEFAKTAKGDLLVFSNSDVIFAPGWVMPFTLHTVPNTIVVGYLVESGIIGVASENIHRDFGKTVDAFDKQAFDFWASSRFDPPVKEERGWYFPCCVDKEWFLSTGGFDTSIPFPHPSDIDYWNRCRDTFGTKFLRVNSYAYHFQRLSSRP